jgi:4,5-dihydroxyphthalate decarboxylase
VACFLPGEIHTTQNVHYMVPRMPRPSVQGAPQVARLFRDPRAEERAYYRRNGFYPIMHVVAVKPEVLDVYPEVAMRPFDAFEQSKRIAFHYYDDPNWSHLAWAITARTWSGSSHTSWTRG